jgi:AcrR family transcriptional regulator
MSYRNLGDIDAEIIKTTVRIAAKNEENRFSTREIANELGISEYVIFSHFESKEKLIAACVAKIGGFFLEEMDNAFNNAKDFYEAFDHLIDYFKKNPCYCSFGINYFRSFPRYEKPYDYEDYQKRMRPTLQSFFKKHPLKEGVDYFAVSAYIVREIACYARLLIDKRVNDTPDNRHFMARLIIAGFAPLSPKELS